MKQTIKMNRKQFLGTIIGATMIGAASAIAYYERRIHWRMATSWPESLDTIYGGAQTICQRVSEMTNGRFTITSYPAGDLVRGLEVLDAVQEGKVECGHTASYYYYNKNPALAFASGVPFGLNAQQQNAWLYKGGGLKEIQSIYADFNVINFPAGNTGVQMGGWFRQKVETVKDLQGLKMRIPGLGGKVMARLGVNVVDLPGGKIFEALEQGEIDAAEWIGPYDDQKLGLNTIAPFYYYPGWWEPGTTLDVLVNLDKWKELPPAYQEIFKTAAFEANARMLAKYDALNRRALMQMIYDDTKTKLSRPTQLIDYSPEIMYAARREAFKLYDENAKKDPTTYKRIYEKWKTFRYEVYQWHKINELSFGIFSFEF